MLNEKPLLIARDLTLDFRIERHLFGDRLIRALDNVSLEIGSGEIVGIVGESGSGKTTLGKTLLGVYRPTGGSIHYCGSNLVQLSKSASRGFRRDLQMVFQDPLSSFNPRFTIGSSLAVALRLYDICKPNEIHAEIGRLLYRVGLSPDFSNRFPHELSGGQLQRVAIARAISVKPKIIVADEAVSKLDVSVRAQILNLLKLINRETGTSIIFITHDLGVARFLCDRIAVMYFGRIVEKGPTGQVFSSPFHPYTAALLAARNLHSESSSDADETVFVPSNPASACNYVARCLRRTKICGIERPQPSALDIKHEVSCFVPLASIQEDNQNFQR
jgi:oligopeptide/dipeptide ABC transporter ATP-binding protein